MMTPSFLALLGIVLCWLGFAAVYLFRKKPTEAVYSKRDAGARNGISLQTLGYLIVWGLGRDFVRPMFPMSLPVEIAVSISTVLLGAASVVLVYLAVRTLGKQWALEAQVVEGHELITTGPYALVRNPIYLGMLGLLMATGLAHSHWWSLVAGIAMFVAGTAIRIRAEEKLLRETFSAQYYAYSRRVPALIPWVY